MRPLTTQETKTVTVSETPTNPASNPGLIIGRKVGIPTGVYFAIIVIGFLVGILILRKRRVSRTERMTQAEAM